MNVEELKIGKKLMKKRMILLLFGKRESGQIVREKKDIYLVIDIATLI